MVSCCVESASATRSPTVNSRSRDDGACPTQPMNFRCAGTLCRRLAGPRGGVSLDMPLACTHASHMSKMVQIRNVPDTLHRKLKVRAADSGQTLSDYLLAELVRLAARPPREQVLARIHSRKRVTLKTPAG